MANLKTFSGFPIQNLTSDPVPYAQALADNPYAGVWSSGGTRNEQAGAIGGTIIGTQTAAVAAGGNISGSVTNKTEEYNGTSWTAGNTLGTARRSLQAAGLESAGLVFGGDTSVNSTGFSNLTETYNGTNWSEANELNTARGAGSGAGLSTAAVAIGGSTGPGAPNYSAVVENWNGSSWTNGTSVNTARIRGGASGIQTSLLFFGGQAAPGASNSVELWNGSSWTETTEINTARGSAGSAGETSTAALFFGGSPSRAITESWDGTSWTEVADLATGQSDNFGVVRGSNISALSSGGESSPNAVSEEWSFSGLNPATTPAADYSDAIVGQMYYNSTSGQFKAIKNGGPPIGSWSSGGNLPQNMILQGAFGGRDSVTTGGGSISTGIVGDSFQYNGVAWSEITELSTVRNQSAGLGTQNAGLVAGGYRLSPGAVVGVVENWNGSSWTEVADVSPVRQGAGSAGVYTAGLVFGGAQPPNTASTMTWNGSAWTEVNDLNAARNRFMGQAIGTQTAALAVEGEGVAGTESWNGTSWTEVNDLNTPRHLGGGSGIQTSAIVSSGRTGAPGYNPSVLCESWDGSSWTEVADVSSARAYLSSAGTAAGNPNATSIIFGGATTSSTANTAATEEWNAADFTINPVTTS